MPDGSHPLICRLETALTYIPGRLRGSHLQRMARLITELLPGRLYRYDYLFHAVVMFHPDAVGDTLLPGGRLLRDLGLLLQKFSAATPLDAAVSEERVIPLQRVAASQRVTLRTVRRWALQGMPLAHYQFQDGPYGWGVREDHLQKFLARRNQKTSRCAGKLSQEEKDVILERIASLKAAGAPAIAQAIRQVSYESGRSTATIRRLLQKQRKARTSKPPNNRRYGGLAPARRNELVRLYRGGAQVHALARRFGRSASTIYRILHRVLMDQILDLKINYVPSQEFALPDAKEICLGQEGLFTYPPETTPDMLKPPAGLPPYLHELYAIPLLGRAREKELFRKYNYLKYRMAMLQERVRCDGYRARTIDRFDDLRKAASQLRRILIRCNLRLVVSVAKHHAGPLASLMELVSEGNVCLMRATQSYDYARNARFATYATWALTKHFARVVPERNYHLQSFVTGRNELFALVGDIRPNPQERMETVAHLRNLLTGALQHLTQREREIIESHFGTNGRTARTLEDIGGIFGVTRERIRQIEACALAKLRNFIGPDALEALT